MKYLIQLIMKIPLFEDEAPVCRIIGEPFEIELNDPQAAQMALENLKWQASNHFFRYPQDLKLIHQEHYEFQYVHTDYECDDNGYVLSMTKKTIASNLDALIDIDMYVYPFSGEEE